MARSAYHRLANGNGIRVRNLDGECYIHRPNCEFAFSADPVFAARERSLQGGLLEPA